MAQTVHEQAVTTVAMVAGNEKVISAIILPVDHIWRWAGIGWIDCGPATRDEIETIPRLVR
jgi:hypothetical protein